MSQSGGEGDEMEEVSDAEMQPLGDAGMQPPPVHEPPKKRRKLANHKIQLPKKNRLYLLDLPVVVLLAILELVENLQSAPAVMHARNAAHLVLNDAQRRSSEALGFCTKWTEEIKEHFMKLQKRDMCDARTKTRQSFPDDPDEVTKDKRYAAVEAAQQEVRKRPRDQDPRCGEYFIEKLQEFVWYFVQIMTRNASPASPGDYFARIRRLSEPSVDAFVRQLRDKCPQKFSLDGVWTIDGMFNFIIQNDTVLLMKKVMCESLQREVDKCRKKCKKCKRQVDFSTGGFRPFLLLEQALAQRREDEKNWPINRIFLIV